MKDLILSIFGAYEPTMTQSAVTSVVEGVSSTDMFETVASGVAGLDWPWIMGVFLFAIVLWSFFRLVGLLIARL